MRRTSGRVVLPLWVLAAILGVSLIAASSTTAAKIPRTHEGSSDVHSAAFSEVSALDSAFAAEVRKSGSHVYDDRSLIANTNAFDPSGSLAPQTARASSGFIDPSDVRFTQNSISQTFRDGRSVSDLAGGLRSGAIDPGDIPAIRLVEHEGKLFSLDNRRLAAFGDAGVNVPYRMATPAEIAREWASKFTTKTDGLSIQLRFW